jgi:hypothetical protein
MLNPDTQTLKLLEADAAREAEEADEFDDELAND